MSSDLARYVVNPGPKAAVAGLKAAVTTDSSIVTGAAPQEGHGIRTLSAKIDHAARIVDWFERYLRNNHDSL
jgi:hypothetical protein